MKSLTRVASHADGWYSGNPQELAKELNKYLSKSEKYEESSSLKSIIVPHSGLCYGGPVALWGSYCSKGIHQCKSFPI